MFTTSQNACNDGSSNFIYLINKSDSNWKFMDSKPLYPTMGRQLIYYSEVETHQPVNQERRRREHQNNHNNYFSKAFKWYTKEHKHHSGPRGSLQDFASWLDVKYDEYIKEKKSYAHHPWHRRRSRKANSMPAKNAAENGENPFFHDKWKENASATACYKSNFSINSSGSPEDCKSREPCSNTCVGCEQDDVYFTEVLTIPEGPSIKDSKRFSSVVLDAEVECQCLEYSMLPVDARIQCECCPICFNQPEQINSPDNKISCECDTEKSKLAKSQDQLDSKVTCECGKKIKKTLPQNQITNASCECRVKRIAKPTQPHGNIQNKVVCNCNTKGPGDKLLCACPKSLMKIRQINEKVNPMNQGKPNATTSEKEVLISDFRLDGSSGSNQMTKRNINTAGSPTLYQNEFGTTCDVACHNTSGLKQAQRDTNIANRLEVRSVKMTCNPHETDSSTIISVNKANSYTTPLRHESCIQTSDHSIILDKDYTSKNAIFMKIVYAKKLNNGIKQR